MNPNFFIVGAPKAGTTSIHEYLKNHVQVFMSEQKEINFFSSKAILNQGLYYKNKICSELTRYLSFFSESVNFKIIGESSVSYLFYKNTAEKIHQFNPNAKILIILRNPIERAFSHYLMDKRLGHTKSDFNSIIRNENKEKNQDLLFQQHVLVGKYYDQIKRYVNLFGNNVLLMQYSELTSSPECFIKKICDFLEIEYDDKIILKKENRYVHANKIIMFLYKINYFRKVVKFIFSIFSKEKSVNLFFSKSKPNICKKDYDFLKSYYKDDIDLMEKEFDFNLKL
tara:strand:- start:855 stop:1703 length:849 start_codon:yes stop_codon:yes gene_type:complete